MPQVLQAKLEQLAQQVLRVKRVLPGQQELPELRALWAKRELRGQQVLRAKQVPLGLPVK